MKVKVCTKSWMNVAFCGAWVLANKNKFGNLLLQLWFWWENLKAEPLQVNFADPLAQYIPVTPIPALWNFQRLRNEISGTTQRVEHGDLGCFLPETASPFNPHENNQPPHKHSLKFSTSVPCSSKSCLLLWGTWKTSKIRFFGSTGALAELTSQTRAHKCSALCRSVAEAHRDLSWVYFPALWPSKN